MLDAHSKLVPEGTSMLTNIAIPLFCKYLIFALCLTVVVRLVLVLLRSYRAAMAPGDKQLMFWSICVRMIVGLDPDKSASKEKDTGDYLAPFFVGFLELLSYPVLIAANLPEYVGAWIGLKTIALYFRWKNDRTLFNTFLVGNALIIIFSWYLSGMIEITK